MTAAAKEREVGATVAGKYRLIRVLGRGGMGVVYEAEHAMTRRRVAVKVLHAHHRESSDAAKRFLNEAQAAGRIQHPNVVEVLDAGEDPSDGSLYLVLELLTGKDLATHLVRFRRLEVAETVTIVAQVLQALVVAHRLGIIHRDIKPENIYLTRSVMGDLHVKLLDFGISKAMNADGAVGLNVTQTNTTVGTPHYMSPEQARGERNIDGRADLWAAGVVFYECLAGRVPFDGETYNDQIVRVITEPHTPLGEYDVPAELSRIVDKVLEKDRNRRYLRAADMLADIRAFIERHPEYSAVPATTLREPSPTGQELETVPAAVTSPTVETSADPALLNVGPGNDTVRTEVAGAELPSLYDGADENAPTTVRDGADLLRSAGLAPPADVTSQLRAQRARHGGTNKALLGVGLVVAALGAGGLAALLSRRGNGASSQSMVSVRFANLPRGARLVVAGTQLFNSDTAVIPRGTTPLLVELSAPGFSGVRFPLVPDQDQTVPLPALAVLATPPPVLVPAPPVVPVSVTPPAPPAPPAPAVLAPAPNVVRPAPPPSARVANSGGALGALFQMPPAAPAAPAGAGVSAATGWVVVHAQPPCNVVIDGQTHGLTPVARVTLLAGAHRVLCQTSTGALRSRMVTVTGGREAAVEFQP